MPPFTDYFADSYADAKSRFLASATAVDATLHCFPVGQATDLSIDVAILGNHDASHTTVISSGLHGVEGFFGSAVQLAWLSHIADPAKIGSRVVLIHVINPHGFANLRRWNEDNVDLNRNFCASTHDYQGAPPSYASLDRLLNPPSPPSRFEPFRIKAIAKILQAGLPAIKQAVAGGQYEYPRGCFFGGHGLCESSRIVEEHYHDWVGDSQHIIHLDLHTGLGKYAQCKLLLEQQQSRQSYVGTFGDQRVEAKASEPAVGTAYDASGSMGSWLHKSMKNRDFRFALAEFGTYGVLRVLAALRAENRAHFFAAPESSCYRRAKTDLRECFCPSDTRWRNEVVRTGIEIIQQAIDSADDQ